MSALKIFKVQMPDGTISEVEAPENSLETDVFDFALQNYRRKEKDNSEVQNTSSETDLAVSAFNAIQDGSYLNVEVSEEFGPEYFTGYNVMPGGGSLSYKDPNPKHQEEKIRLQRENLVDNLSTILNVNPENIDIESGLGSGIRAAMSFQTDEEGKIATLQSEYGDNNVSSFLIAGKPSYMVYDESKGIYQLVDEQGASFGDVADFTRDIVTTAPELAVPLGLLKILKLGRTTKPFKLARDIGLAKGISEYTAEGIEEGLSYEMVKGEGLQRRSDPDFNLLNPLIEGAKAFGIDYAIGKPLDYFTRVVAPGRAGDNLEFDKLDTAIKDLEKKYGIEIPVTEGMGLSRDIARAEAILADRDPFFAEKRALFRSAIFKIEEAIKKGDTGSFNDLVSDFRVNYKNLKTKTDQSLAEGDALLSRSLDNYTNNVIDNASSNNMSTNAAANNIRKTLQSHDDVVTNTSNQLYQEATNLGSDIPETTFLELAQTLINGLPDVPRDTKNRILASFLPPESRRILRQSSELKNSIPRPEDIGLVDFDSNPIQLLLDFDGVAEEAMPKLTWKQMMDLRKHFNKVYRSLDSTKNNIDKKTISDTIKAIDGLLETKAVSVQSPAFDVLQQANDFYRVNKVPLLEDRIFQNTIKRGADGAYVSEGEDVSVVIGKIFNKNNPQRFTQLNRIRALAPDANAFDDQIRDYIISGIKKQYTTSGGAINMPALTKLLNDPDLVKRYFNDSVIRDLEYLNKNYVKLLGGLSQTNPAALNIPQSLLEDFLKISDTQGRKQILASIEQSIALNNKVLLLKKNKFLKQINEGGPNVGLNEDEIIDILPTMKPAELQDVFDFVSPESKEIIKAKFKTRIIDNARFGSGIESGVELGGKELADANVLFNIINNPKTKKKMEVIFDKEEIADLNNLAILLRESGEIEKGIQPQGLLRAYSSPSSQFQNSRYILSGNRSRLYASLNFDSIYTRLIGIALKTPGVRNIIAGRGKEADKLLDALLPSILASEEATSVLINEMTTDPRFEEHIINEIKTSDSDRLNAFLESFKNIQNQGK